MKKPALLALVLATASASCAAASAAGPGILYEADSPYNHLIVDQDAVGVRRLFFEKHGAIQSAIKPDAPLQLELPYSRTAMLSLAVLDGPPKKVLVLGLGGGAMPKYLRKLYKDVEIEAVDIDPGVVKVAKKFFGFAEDKKLKAHVGDGRKWIEEAKGGWDLVFLDAYGKGSIPRHLATVEFLKMVKGKLAPGALVIGNVWEPASNPLYERMARTYAEVFPEMCVKNVPESGNRIFFVNRPVPPGEQLAARAAELEKAHKLPYETRSYALVECVKEVDATAQLLLDADEAKPAPAPAKP